MPVHDQTNSYTYLDSPERVAEFISSVAGVRSVAIDTEGASFHRYVDRVYLIQLTAGEQDAIIDPLCMDIPPGLGGIMSDSDVQIVFHDADYDLRLLHQDYGWEVRNLFDTRVAAQLLGIRQFGLGALLENYFGVRLDKKFQRADWSMRPLSSEMLDYAALDTSHLLALRDVLHLALEQKGRVEWALEEFERIEGTRWLSDGADDDAFLRIKGARDLTREELAVLRELNLWRDAVARELDRAVFRVIGNEALIALAQSKARSLADLSNIRGVPRALLARRGDELMAALERGRSVPSEKLPRFPRARRYDKDPGFDDRVARLRSVRDASATRLDMDPGVLCSREKLETIARRLPRTLQELQDVDGIRRWQVAELGEAFLQALDR